MIFIELIRESRLILEESNKQYDKLIGFGDGGVWMSEYLESGKSISKKEFRRVGFSKYILSSAGFLISAALFEMNSIWYIIASILFFYTIEVHFLFIFPLLIDDEKPLIRKSFESLYKVGFLKAIVNVVPIGFYMLMGLLDFKAPFYRWYVGCLAILIWYEKEVRYRV